MSCMVTLDTSQFEEHMKSMRKLSKSSWSFASMYDRLPSRCPREYNGIRWDEDIENRKSSTRCKVEHPFLIVKRQFGYCKTAYKGLAKNMNRFNIFLPVQIF